MYPYPNRWINKGLGWLTMTALLAPVVAIVKVNWDSNPRATVCKALPGCKVIFAPEWSLPFSNEWNVRGDTFVMTKAVGAKSMDELRQYIADAGEKEAWARTTPLIRYLNVGRPVVKDIHFELLEPAKEPASRPHKKNKGRKG
ncbi:hypothetical protein [Pseudogulbenkiania sp. MAI-1]|uniref:hypothetical protein n=1 Tax=Pseudogulbenkiania sp. MAI-1 TaxID=990370 RepID=UPI00045E7D97|nr:hypothetical protein [Pseudogulbenkiania sp. MAI-1]